MPGSTSGQASAIWWRQVLGGSIKKCTLALTVRRFAQARPHTLEISRDRDRRTPSAKRAARSHFARLWSACCAATIPTGAWIKTSSPPVWTWSKVLAGVCTRPAQERASSFAVLGVNGQRRRLPVDAALPFGLLWLDAAAS